jgi:CrcB protein
VSAATWIGLGLAGGVGAVARIALDATMSARRPGLFPLGTLVVNLTGALALGLIAGVALRGAALSVLGTGLIGSYTTFSTWMLESHRLGEEGEMALGWLNLVGSLVLGLGAVALGRAL